MKKIFMPGCVILAVAICIFSNPNAAQAGTQEHLHRLAVTIESKAKLLLRETHHYRHAAGYRQLVSDVSKLVRTAEHVHDTTYCSRSFRYLEADMRILDRCFHQVEDFFDQIERDAAHGIGHYT